LLAMSTLSMLLFIGRALTIALAVFIEHSSVGQGIGHAHSKPVPHGQPQGWLSIQNMRKHGMQAEHSKYAKTWGPEAHMDEQRLLRKEPPPLDGVSVLCTLALARWRCLRCFLLRCVVLASGRSRCIFK